MARLSGGEGENVINHDRVIFFIAFARDVTQVRCAGYVIILSSG